MTASAPPLATVSACVFDAYGTLFDVTSAVRRRREALGEDWDSLAALWRTKQLEYTWLRSLMGDYADFRQVTAEALDFALDTHGGAADGLREELLALYDRLDCYAEVPGVLAALRDGGKRTAILSNGAPAMLASAVGHAGLAPLLDDVLSADSLRVYKPHPDVYALATGRLGKPPEEIAFFSSNAWDAAGAAAFGFRVVWVNRFGQSRERLPAGPEVELDSLEQVPALLAL
jgi:2-haloacid dehalogenase